MRSYRSILFFINVYFIALHVGAQTTGTEAQLAIRRLNSLGTQSQTNITPESKVVGSFYLYDDSWNNSTLTLTDDQKIENYKVRFDIKSNQFEIKVDNEIKVLPGKKVKEFTIDAFNPEKAENAKQNYVNAEQYKIEGVNLSGFMEVISPGKVSVFKRTELVIKKPDYSVQFNVGSRDTQILKKSELYYAKGNELVELPKTNKKLATIFQADADRVTDYIEEKDLRVKNESDAKEIFDFFNQLK